MIEERDELMVPLSTFLDSNTTPKLRKAHFLKPILDPNNQSLPKPPCFSVPSTFNIKKLKSNVAFYGRPNPQNNWHLWVGSLQEIHQCTWKEVGIFDAIKASTYKLSWDNELIFGLAENWCPETNTFVFPWGECTITLEDIMILAGYSVLGTCVNNILDPVFVELGNELIGGFKKSKRKIHGGLLQSDWRDYFMNIGGELEHMAFLALWLSRFVFSTDSYSTVSPYVVPIAVALAKGMKIALAPAVLASIYRDLTLLKERIVSIVNKRGCSVSKKLILFAPFQLVQLWAWERFPTLCPEPITLFLGEPRLARWKRVKKFEGRSSIMKFETLGEEFLWRPYVLPMENWESREFYSDEERLVVLNSDVNEEILRFARCLRSCELVGFDCIEQYLPQRVARQFGLDQGIPSSTPRLNGNMKLAWSTYDIPFDSVALYLSPRLFKGDVSVGYFDWYKSSFNHSNTSFVTSRRPSNIPLSKMNLKLRKNIGGIEEENTELSPDCLTSLHSVPLASSCSVSAVDIRPQKIDGSEKNYTEKTLPQLNSFNAAMDSALVDNITDMGIENNVLNDNIVEEATSSPTLELAVNGMDSQIENLDNCEEHCGNNTRGDKKVMSVTEMHNEAVPSFQRSISPSKINDNSCQNIPTQSIQMVVVNEVGSSINSAMKDISNKLSLGAQPSVKPLVEDDESVPNKKKKIYPLSAHVVEDQAAKYGNAAFVKGSMDEPMIISDDEHDNDDEDDGQVGDVNPFAERESKLERRIDKLGSIISRLKAEKLRSKE